MLMEADELVLDEPGSADAVLQSVVVMVDVGILALQTPKASAMVGMRNRILKCLNGAKKVNAMG